MVIWDRKNENQSLDTQRKGRQGYTVVGNHKGMELDWKTKNNTNTY